MDPEIRFRCTGCKKRIVTPEKMAGRTVNCPACKTQLTVPPPEKHHVEEEEDEFASHGSGAGEFGELDLTPMVDVAMLLLMFFIILATKVEQKTLETPPPSAQRKEDDSSGGSSSTSQQDYEDIEEASIIVGINERNAFTVDEAPIAPNDLLSKLRQGRAAGKVEIVIDAHPDAFHDAVVQVIDAANEIGVQKIRITSSRGGDE